MPAAGAISGGVMISVQDLGFSDPGSITQQPCIRHFTLINKIGEQLTVITFFVCFNIPR